MRKINISNDAKRDAEVAFGTHFKRPTPVYKTANGSVGINERRLKATMSATDDALIAAHGDALADALAAAGHDIDLTGQIKRLIHDLLPPFRSGSRSTVRSRRQRAWWCR